MAEKTVDSYQAGGEREYLEQNVFTVQFAEYTGDESSEKLGEQLSKKSSDNPHWHLVEVSDTTYGNDEDWYFVEQGTDLPGYGTAQHSWLVNYETGEILQLEDYKEYKAGEMLAVNDDSLILNVDLSLLDKEGVSNNQQSLQSALGDGVILHNFDYGVNDEGHNSGLTSTSFDFDGKDDYIDIKYDSENQVNNIINNGFTFEFYGIWNKGYCEQIEPASDRYYGLFSYYNDQTDTYDPLKFVVNNGGRVWWSAGTTNDYSDGSVDYRGPQNVHFPKTALDMNTMAGSEQYITITLDTKESHEVQNGTYQDAHEKAGKKNGDFYTTKIFVNGEHKYTGDYNKLQWDNFKNTKKDDLKCFSIGRTHFRDDHSYSKMTCYALRLYSRALTNDEVLANYTKAVGYRSRLNS